MMLSLDPPSWDPHNVSVQACSNSFHPSTAIYNWFPSEACKLFNDVHSEDQDMGSSQKERKNPLFAHYATTVHSAEFTQNLILKETYGYSFLLVT